MPDVTIRNSPEVGRATVTSGSAKGKTWVLNSIPGAWEFDNRAFAYIEDEDIQPLIAACRTSLIDYEYIAS